MADQTTGGATTLNGLTDVNAGSPSNNQVLAYNASNSKWEAQNASGGGGIERYQYEQTTGSVAANTAITFTSGTGFNGATPTLADTQVYLNGQLLLGGSQTDLNAGDVDYHLVNDTQIKLLHATTVGDIIAIFHTTTSFSTGKPFLLYSDDASFNNRKVITAGDGITINQASGQDFIINNSGLIQRTKITFTPSSEATQNSNVGVTFPGGANTFASAGYSDHRIDIFINGVMKFKDDHYEVNSTLGASTFKWIDSNSIATSDKITVIIF